MENDPALAELHEQWERFEDAKPLTPEIIEKVNVRTEEKVREVQISASLDKATRDRMIELLREFKDVFAWCYEDMPGLDPTIVKHTLPIDTNIHKPKRQHLRRQHPDLVLKIKEEVIKLIDAKFVEVSSYLEWVYASINCEKE